MNGKNGNIKINHINHDENDKVILIIRPNIANHKITKYSIDSKFIYIIQQ